MQKNYLIENGELFTPARAGVKSILSLNGSIYKVGNIEREKLLASGLEIEVIDASGCLVTPGLIDPHEHLIGAGGEEGFSSRVPEVHLSQIIQAGITTVVGCLGTDVVARNLNSLLAKARQLEQDGISAYMLTGGFHIPPPTITTSVMNDIIIIDKAIGVGEISISDYRSSEPTLHEAARAISDAIIGGMIGGKAGVSHFHVGEGKRRLELLFTLLDSSSFEIPPEYLYPTHITRSHELLDEAIQLAGRGSFVDMDTTEEDLAENLRYYIEHGGKLDQLTVSSDSHTPSGNPHKYFGQFVSCVRDHKIPLEQVLPLFTSNPASVYKLQGKGRLKEGCDADIVILEKETFEIRHLFARGKQMIAEGKLCAREQYEDMAK
ncbi:MAG TPA: beta-aspartyl-peptidase [Chloroflexia bacterium]|nr:beta-aspartyl-peptidase [Chloroflexia bacterium]